MAFEAHVLWPWGYSARFDPFVVYDNRGKLVARAGDHLNGGGWGPEQGDPDACDRTAYITMYDEIELAGPWRQAFGELDAFAALPSRETAIVILEPRPGRVGLS